MVPTFGSRISTTDGFIVPISNYDPDFSYTVKVKKGPLSERIILSEDTFKSWTDTGGIGQAAASIANDKITVSGLGITGQTANVLVKTTRTNKGKSVAGYGVVGWASLGGLGGAAEKFPEG